jgi:uncharacterized protein YegP (UPF0339 family)
MKATNGAILFGSSFTRSKSVFRAASTSAKWNSEEKGVKDK